MKKILISALLFAGVAVASDDLTQIVCVNKVGTTSTNTTAQKYNGFVDSFWVDITGTTTGTITITSQRTGEQILSAVTSADVVYRPRVGICTTAGGTPGAGTNLLERIKLVEEALVIKVAETAGVTNSYNVWIKVSDK